MKIKTIILLLIASLMFVSCMDYIDSYHIKVNNKSDKSIYFIISEDDTSMFDYEKYLLRERIKNGEHFSEINLTGLKMSEEIKPDFIIEDIKGYKDWKRSIKSIKDKKVRFYIVEKDSVDKYGWKYINDNTVYNKKYLLTLKDLKNMNWEIIYEQLGMNVHNDSEGHRNHWVEIQASTLAYYYFGKPEKFHISNTMNTTYSSMQILNSLYNI